MINNSALKTIFLSSIACLLIQTTCFANRVVYVRQPIAQSDVKSFAQEAVKKSAAVATIGSLGYGAFEIARAFNYWLKTDRHNQDEMQKKQNKSILYAFAALCVAAATGTIATADLSTVNFNIQLDIVRLLELILRSANDR